MARKFGFPTVAALEIGQSTVLQAKVGEVKRKVALYGARNGKRFSASFSANMEEGPVGVVVTRLPDPEPQP